MTNDEYNTRSGGTPMDKETGLRHMIGHHRVRAELNQYAENIRAAKKYEAALEIHLRQQAGLPVETMAEKKERAARAWDEGVVAYYLKQQEG
jgi:hypothetical protein